MTTGPSKEDLQNYWNTSRQYFDELAKYYQTADPEYYSKFIAPFYSSLLFSATSNKGSSKSVWILLVSVFTFLIIGIGAFAVFYFVQNEPDKTDYKKNNPTEETKSTEKTIPSEEIKSPDSDNEPPSFPDDDFLLASKYIAEKDYDKAEEHLKKIKPGSKNYKQAQQLLESIKYLRKYNK